MHKKLQLVCIHGGMTFKNKKEYLDFLRTLEIKLEKKAKWQQEYLDKKLGKTFEIIRPQMPLKENAKYEDWKIYFERYVAVLGKEFVLMGNSLGGVFLAKYLSENILKHKARAVFLVCPPFDNSLDGEDLVGGFTLGKDLSGIEKNTKVLHLMFSEDDPVVPVAHADKYKRKLPHAHFHVYKSKGGHFQIPEFPEIVTLLKQV